MARSRDATLSPATVKKHINRIFAKLEVRDRIQVVILAHHHLGFRLGPTLLR